MNTETKKINSYNNDGEYDSKIPIDLYNWFVEFLNKSSNETFEATSIYYNKDVDGVSCGIMKSVDGNTVKTEYVINLIERK
jgi:hypothetical protein